MPNEELKPTATPGTWLCSSHSAPQLDSGALDRRHAPHLVRIALSGTHAVGKSTLSADLHEELAAYAFVDEPYYQLLDEGHIFADTPSVDDIVAQLERSIVKLRSERATDVLYDRCPADFLAYLSALEAHDSVREWLGPAGDALRALDLIVFVPIEQPDRIADAADADRLRRTVDALLREMLVEDSCGFDRPILSVHGPATARARQVVAAIQQRGFHTRDGAV